ncbi:hypothetical protein FisN_14Hu099 [Fistulifera solaris]|uniref:Uncharacterized protein n=1 Tax=Fistulifera solaris TaxID=1519565 RepID=A0A1Z5K897_FISSO|nr:hypothetical protein FisN_14Hu099 [Fistulifera solaris]|eukprot:GAX22483.1 hypothetical protein FisN_14Hu099 [Fistulifera solaris]
MTDKLAAIKRPWPVLRFLKETLDAAFTYPTIMHVCEVGDLIGINTPGLVLSTQHAYRVECITWMHTSLVCLATGERQRRHNSRIFNINGVNKWSRSPATFEVVLPVGDNGGVSLEFFKEKIEQFANDNPGEWREVNTFDWYQLPEGHRVLIQHHEKWGQLKLVLKSREKLIAYCKQLTEELRPEDASQDFAVTVSP